MSFFLRHLQIVRIGDLQVRWKVHPNLDMIVCNISEHEFIEFLQSWSFGVMPTGESRIIFLILYCAHDQDTQNSTFLWSIRQRRVMQPLKEWLIIVIFSCLKQSMTLCSPSTKNQMISSVPVILYDLGLQLRPIPLISQSITLAFFRMYFNPGKYIRDVPPNPWLRQTYSSVGYSDSIQIKCMKSGFFPGIGISQI